MLRLTGRLLCCPAEARAAPGRSAPGLQQSSRGGVNERLRRMFRNGCIQKQHCTCSCSQKLIEQPSLTLNTRLNQVGSGCPPSVGCGRSSCHQAPPVLSRCLGASYEAAERGGELRAAAGREQAAPERRLGWRRRRRRRQCCRPYHRRAAAAHRSRSRCLCTLPDAGPVAQAGLEVGPQPLQPGPLLACLWAMRYCTHKRGQDSTAIAG